MGESRGDGLETGSACKADSVSRAASIMMDPAMEDQDSLPGVAKRDEEQPLHSDGAKPGPGEELLDTPEIVVWLKVTARMMNKAVGDGRCLKEILIIIGERWQQAITHIPQYLHAEAQNQVEQIEL